MSRNSRSFPLMPQRRFLFSAISHEVEESLKEKIESLDGKVVCPAKNTFSSLCTHVIAREFSPTEKIMGALAGGKWLLTVNYILDSHTKGYWLNEKDYEYTNFNKVAAYHRHKREQKKCGPYDGWKILVLMEIPSASRTFKRILSAGGAEIASKDDISDVDFVITRKELVETAQGIVHSFIPLVDVSYVKDTIIFRNDPADLRKCDLRQIPRLERSCKSATYTASTSKSICDIQHGHSSSKRPIRESFLSKKRQICSKKKQITMTKFLQPLVSKLSLNDKTSEKRQTVAENNNLLDTNSVVSSSQCNILPKIPVIDVEDEPLINTISKRQQTKTTPKDVIPVPSKSWHLKQKVYSVDQPPQDMSPPIEHYANLKECYINLGTKTDERWSCMSNQPTIDFPVLENISRKLFIERNMAMSEQLQNNSRTGKFLRKPFQSLDSLEQSPRETVPSKQLSRRQSLQCNTTSSEEPHNERLPSKSPSYTITKLDAKKAIVAFLRMRKCLSGVCCTSLLSIPIRSEHYSKIESKLFKESFDSEYVLDTPNYQHNADEHRELTPREINLYTCFVTPELHDKELHVHGLDTLLIQLSSYLYPPAAILGSLVKDLVLETPYRIVHSRALRVAYRVLSLHSPVTRKMRKYYLDVLETAMQPDTSGNYTAWEFIQSVIHCASNNDIDEISLSQKTEEDEGFDLATKALNLLEFLTILITEDVNNSAYGKAVQELLMWDIFWGSSKSCNVLPPPVKQLIRLWMSQQTTCPTLRWHLAHFVSVLFEMMWKLSGYPLVPVTTLPETLGSLRMEIGIHVKGLSSQQCLKVIRNLHIPWAQSVITFIILQEIVQYPKEMTLSKIMKLFFNTGKHSSSNAVTKSETTKKVHNNFLQNLDQSPKASRRISIPNINKRNLKGETALLRACIKNNVERVKLLLKDPGVDINLCDNCGWTPLHEAALRGNVECIKLILNHKAQSNKTTPNSHFKKDCSNLALNICATDFKDQKTALHDAVSENRLESVKLLLDYEDEDLLKATTRDGKTAFDLAPTEEMFRLLKMYKSKLNCKTKSISPTFEHQKYHKELFIILANSYLEVSGNRSIFYTIKKCIYKVVKENMEETEKVNDSTCHTVDEMMKKEIPKNHAPKYINLIENESMEDLSELEEKAVAKIYNCIKQDKEVHKKGLLQSSALVMKLDPRNFFNTLCL